MTDAPMPSDLAATPLGEAVQLVVNHVRSAGSAPLEVFLAQWPPQIAARVKEMMAALGARLGAFEVTGYRVSKAHICLADLQGEDGRRWALGVALADGGIAFDAFPRPPGLSYRPVADADADALAALELAAPIVTGDIETAYDRSRDYFEAERLMGAGEAFVVEREGAIVGLFACVVHPVRIGGRVGGGVYDHRVRVHPAARGSGVMGLAALGRFEAIAGLPGPLVLYGFVAAGNDAVLNSIRGPRWAEMPERLVIDTAGAGAVGSGRRAGPADAARLVALLNDTHDAEELFCPYGPDSLRERLSRAPRSYSWSNFLISDRACVGVWAPKMGVVRRERGVERRDVRAFVLDYGCTADGVGELAALVNEWRARLAAEGTTELSIFSSAGSRANAQLSALAKRREPYVVLCGVPPGEHARERGVYVDQLYF